MNSRRSYKLAIISPFYNEQEGVSAFVAEISKLVGSLPCETVPIFVDDGSGDATLERLINECRKHLPAAVIVELSRNFGKERALLAGLDASLDAGADVVVMLDSDLQHPPELIPKLLDEWQGGSDTVIAKRMDRSSDGALRRFFSRMFYRVMNRMSSVEINDGDGDFRLLDRRVVEAVCSLRESNRFMKGLYSWVGFRKSYLPYTPNARSTGESSFNLLRLFSLAAEGITSFSASPLRIALYIGLIIGGLSLAYASWIIAVTLVYGRVIPGYASILSAIFLLSGVQLIAIGLLGEYLGRLYGESKNRPAYVMRKVYRGDGPSSVEVRERPLFSRNSNEMHR